MNDIQFTCQLCSYLLSYPDETFHSSLALIKDDLNEINSPEMRKPLAFFLNEATKQTSSELISTFVQTFDFGRQTNLYVTYMTSGEQRERSIDLLYLKNYYTLHGFSATDKELPDFLPLMLEFASQVTDETRNPVFSKYFDNIKEIATRLETSDNLYANILEAVLAALNESGVNKSTRRSEELCLDNSCG